MSREVTKHVAQHIERRAAVASGHQGDQSIDPSGPRRKRQVMKQRLHESRHILDRFVDRRAGAQARLQQPGALQKRRRRPGHVCQQPQGVNGVRRFDRGDAEAAGSRQGKADAALQRGRRIDTARVRDRADHLMQPLAVAHANVAGDFDISRLNAHFDDRTFPQIEVNSPEIRGTRALDAQLPLRRDDEVGGRENGIDYCRFHRSMK